ncbi:hypothetical protein ACTXT7_002344 [Hymenolepis weldensis]
MKTHFRERILKLRSVTNFPNYIGKQNALEWISKAEVDIKLRGLKPSSFLLLRLLPPKAKLIVKAIGLDEHTDYEIFKQTLIKLCRPASNLPRLSTFMDVGVKSEDNIEVHAKEIYETVERLLTHPNTEELIEHISLDAYIYSSNQQLSQYLAVKRPKTIKEAIRLTYKFKEKIENDKMEEDITSIAKNIESMCPNVEKVPKKKRILLERNSLD